MCVCVCVCVCVGENMCQVRKKFQNDYSKKYPHYAGVEAVGTDECLIFLEGSWYLTVANLHGVNTLDSQFQAINTTRRGSQSSWRINHWLSQASMSHTRQEGEDKKDWTRKRPGESKKSEEDGTLKVEGLEPLSTDYCNHKREIQETNTKVSFC